ncbi:MAG TPA: ABC transporter permease [Tissierellia bacterium]|mgnify:CR=1 FL=1|nr:ABC transporter permease [Tissierellia bacterium]
MIRYISSRLIQSVITLFAVLTIVFMLMRLMPVEGYLGESYDKLDEIQREKIIENLGLKDPIHVQLKKFYKRVASGDLGVSIAYRPGVPVAEILKSKIPYSLGFGIASLSISIISGITLGIFMADSEGKILKRVGNIYIILINSIPAAIYYILIQFYITDIFKLPMLFYIDRPISWILPVLSLSLGTTATYALWMKRYMVDELNKDYVKLAMAKGLKRREVMKKHVFLNAFVPMIQYLPSSILFTISGSIYIESLYSIPGMGGLLVEAVQRQDNPLVEAIVLIYSSIGIIGMLAGDVLMAILDPRIKLGKREGRI